MIATDYNCESLGLSRLCLMENAGKAISDEVAKICTYKFSHPVKIVIFTGSGGNGGDGFVAARHLLNRGFEVDIFNLANENNINSSDSLINYNILQEMKDLFSNLSIININDSKIFDNMSSDSLSKERDSSNLDYIIIDALLGTGICGNLRDPLRSAISFINSSPAIKVSIDVPSGMDPKDGYIEDIAVKPDYTISLHKVKTGVRESKEELVGGIIVSDIGIPLEAEILTGSGDLHRLKKRYSNSHKGQNGKILIVGGSDFYSGAPALAGLASLSSGADIVFIACPEYVADNIRNYSPNFIVKNLKGKYLNLDNVEDILDLSKNVDCVLMGCGAGLNEETSKLLNILCHKINKPIVLDADALKLVDKKIIINKKNIVLTPHKSEFKSFFNESVEFDLKDNIPDFVKQIQKIVSNIEATIVLKGEIDLIINSKRFKLNKTGNSGMTVGGTGDVLAGIISSLISQGNDIFTSALVGTYINGLAGELAHEKYGYNFSALDLIKFLKNLSNDS